MATMTQRRVAELMEGGRDAKVVVKLKRGHAGKPENQRRILKSLGLMCVPFAAYTGRAWAAHVRR